MHVVDPTRPELQYRIDSFVVPAAAREELLATMRRNMAFIRTLPGFVGHTVLEKRAGDAPHEIVTIATWADRAALERARDEVRAHYRRIGFDMPAALARWGVTMARADYEAPAQLQ